MPSADFVYRTATKMSAPVASGEMLSSEGGGGPLVATTAKAAANNAAIRAGPRCTLRIRPFRDQARYDSGSIERAVRSVGSTVTLTGKPRSPAMDVIQADAGDETFSPTKTRAATM